MDRKPAWIHGPAIDLIFFAFPWVPFVLAYGAYVWLSGSPVCQLPELARGLGSCGTWMLGFGFVADTLLYVHRHYTFGIVYSDPEELARYRRSYTWTPLLLFLVIIVPFGSYKYLPREVAPAMRVFYAFVAAPEGIWAAYHFLMQRYGFLRTYSVRLGYGDARLERRMLLSWAAFFLAMAARWHGDEFLPAIEQTQRIHLPWLAHVFEAVGWLWAPALPPMLYFTARWVRQELREGTRASFPKWALALSTLLMMGTFKVSILIGYLTVITSHSIEYIAFVNLYARRKEALRRWSRAPWLGNAALFAGVLGVYALFRRHSSALVYGYTVSGGYLHFYYDSRLWRLREPRTRALVVGPLGAGQAAPEAL